MLQVSKVSKESKLRHHVAKAGRWLCEAREVWAMEILWIKLAKPIKFVEYCFCLQLLVSKQIWKGSFKTLQPMRPQHFLESLPGALKNGTVHLCFSPSLYPCAFCFPPGRSPHEGDSASLLRWELSAVSKPLSQKRHLKLSFKKDAKKTKNVWRRQSLRPSPLWCLPELLAASAASSPGTDRDCRVKASQTERI